MRQLTGRGPAVWALFVAGGFLTVALGVLAPSGAAASLAQSAPVIIFLFSLFLFVGGLERAGAIDHIARWLIGRARHPSELPLVLFLGFGLLAGFIVNDALVLLGVPILLNLARRVGVDPKPLLLSLAFSVTVGSVLTPMGNPQNLLVSLSSGLDGPVTTFLRYLAIPTAVNLVLGGLYLKFLYARRLGSSPAAFEELRRSAPPLFPPGPWRPRIVGHPALWLFPITLLVLITVDVTSIIVHGPAVPVYAIALGGAVVLLLVAPDRGRLLGSVDWTILLLFAGLFVVVGGAEAGGVISGLEGLLPLPAPSQHLGGLGLIVLASLGGPQLVSNVPWVALQIPLLHSLGYGGSTPLAWVALAGASTLAGNLTLLGAASNLIVVERAEKQGVRLSLTEFVRDGAPLALLSVGVLYGALALGL